MDLRLVFATHNSNKTREIQANMPPGVLILSLDDIGCEDDIPETGSTLEENALIKARHIWENYGMSCFADDTGLEIDALNGEPGIFSARYAGPEKDALSNMDKVLANMGTTTNRKARFKTVLALILHGETHIFEGTVEGNITYEKRGTMGFGYDPIFEPEHHGKTFSEMSLVEKNTVSHRARAFEKMIGLITSLQF